MAPAPPSRAELSRDRIAEAALAFLDRHGFEALSMRRLAAELDVGTMTLYGYFRDKNQLLDAVVDVAARDVPETGGSGAWRDRLRQLMLALRDGLERHPSLVRLRAQRPTLTPGALRLADAAIAILLEAGFDKAESANAYRALFSYAYGFSGNTPPGSTEDHRRQYRAVLATLPADEYPALYAVATEGIEAMGGEERFEYGLDRLLDGLEARLSALG